MAMATPIAHKGVTAGAKVQAMTMLDLLMRPELVDAGVGLLPRRADARTQKYQPLIRPQDTPAIELNREQHGQSTARR